MPSPAAAPLMSRRAATWRQDAFVPSHPDGLVRVYNCGPTVYDAAHMGHARSYVAFDIIRRVMVHYFGLRVLWIMNITDVDDKIILRARQRHLLDMYTAGVSDKPLADVAADVERAVARYRAKVEAAREHNAADPKLPMYSKVLQAADEALTLARKSPAEDSVEPRRALLRAASDPLSEWLDAQHGASVSDPGIFTQLARHWEREFHRDMADLSVLEPDVLTRVSEYVPEIIEYVKRIMANGYAYESNGSVYFDTVAFDGHNGHCYGRIAPEAVGDAASLAEGEGELGAAATAACPKRSPRDFALWKRSKPGEPRWDSPWGLGRPGWHIECSTMASTIAATDRLDIHCGGYDLRFPHHENEMAQAEAYFDCPQWVSYFLHSGHLEIENCKMSKSLKNFITIKEALTKYTARQLRLLFLMHRWSDTLDYSAAAMETALATERRLNVRRAVRPVGEEEEEEEGMRWSTCCRD